MLVFTFVSTIKMEMDAPLVFCFLGLVRGSLSPALLRSVLLS